MKFFGNQIISLLILQVESVFQLMDLIMIMESGGYHTKNELSTVHNG